MRRVNAVLNSDGDPLQLTMLRQHAHQPTDSKNSLNDARIVRCFLLLQSTVSVVLKSRHLCCMQYVARRARHAHVINCHPAVSDLL